MVYKPIVIICRYACATSKPCLFFNTVLTFKYFAHLYELINMYNDMIQYATRFDFPTSGGASNTVTVEKVYDDDNYYWTIKLGGSRWSKLHQVFRYRDGLETIEEYENDTKYSLTDAFELASTKDLYAEHTKHISEPSGIPQIYIVDSTIYALDRAFTRELKPEVKTNDELAKARADKLKEEGYKVFILIGSRGDMVFDAVYKVKEQLNQRQKLSQHL